MLLSNYVRRFALRQGALFQRSKPSLIYTSVVPKSSGSAQQQMDEFWAKNKQRNRPLSPHLTIYKPQLTSMLSITTRITGIALAGATSLFALLTATYSGDISSIFCMVESLKQTWPGWFALCTIKTLLAWPFAFHTCNGLRHLLWDVAKGLTLKEVYFSGWVVVFASLLLSDLLVFCY